MGKVLVDISGITPDFNEQIQHQLKQKNFPICYGKMNPPLLHTTVEIEDSLILSHPFSTTSVVSIDPSEIIEGSPSIMSGLKLSQPGFEQVVEDKSKLITKYIDQITACPECKYKDICFRISSLSLKALEVHYNTKIN